MKSDFMVKTAKIIAEVRTRTCIDKIDEEVIDEILQAELKECYDELNDCYDEGYDDGYSDGHPDGHSDGYAEGYAEGHSEVKNFDKDEYNMSDYSIKLGDSVGSGVHVHSQGEIYPVIQMYIGQEKVFTYANKVLPYSMKQQVLDAVADGTPAIRELFSTSTRELYTF